MNEYGKCLLQLLVHRQNPVSIENRKHNQIYRPNITSIEKAKRYLAERRFIHALIPDTDIDSSALYKFARIMFAYTLRKRPILIHFCKNH
jgi:hypothetical protein